MRRSRIPLEERLEMLRLINERKRLKKRRRRLYNRKFRKSRFFITVTSVRALYMVCFVLMLFLHYESGGFSTETVTDSYAETYTGRTKYGRSYTETVLEVETDQESYSTTLGGQVSSPFEKGDELLIERNIFGRPLYFTQAGSAFMYPTDDPFVLYYMVFFLTFISLFFHDGLEAFTVRFLWIIGIVNVIGMLAYFLNLY